MVGALSQPILMVKGALAMPIVLKPVTQPPIVDTKRIPWNYGRTVMTYHGKKVVEDVDEVRGLTRSGRCFVPESLGKSQLTVSGPSSIKKPITK